MDADLVTEEEPLMRLDSETDQETHKTKRLRVSYLYNERSRWNMTGLCFIYLVTGILYVTTVKASFNPATSCQTHTSIRLGLGPDFEINNQWAIKDKSDLYYWLDFTFLPQFFPPESDDTLQRWYRDFLQVYRGALMLQWKRDPPPNYCAVNGLKHCYGGPLDKPLSSMLSDLQSMFNNATINQSTSIRQIVNQSQFRDSMSAEFLVLNYQEAKQIIDNMKDTNWMNQNSSQLEIFLIFLNPSSALTTFVKISVSLRLGGLVETDLIVKSYPDFQSVNILEKIHLMTVLANGPHSRQLDRSDYFAVFALQALSMIAILFPVIIELIISFNTWRKRRIDGLPLSLKYLSTTTGCAVSLAASVSSLGLWLHLILSEPADLFLDPYIASNNPVTEASYFIEKLKTLEYLYQINYIIKLLVTLNILLLGFRVLMLLDYYSTFKSINHTVARVIIPVFFLLTYIFILLLCFAMIGNIHFGPNSFYFESFTISIETMYRFMTLADFPYEYIQASQAERSLYVVYYWVVVFFFYFILTNMFVAIIYDAFDAERLKAVSFRRQTSNLFRSLKSFFTGLWPHWILRKLGRHDKGDVLSLDDLIQKHGLEVGYAQNILNLFGEYSNGTIQVE